MRNTIGRDQRDYIRFRESDTSDDWTKKTKEDGSFFSTKRPSCWSDDSRSESSHESHAGKGPQGYQRSKERIKEEASDILLHDHDLDASDIEIDVRDRCLFLKGEVMSRYDKKLAEWLVEDISGIDDVQNQLVIRKDYSEELKKGGLNG